MPRRSRFVAAGQVFHITNRGVERRTLFSCERDYREFLRFLAIAKSKHPVKVFGLCLMPNHFHALLQPATDSALSAYLHWVQGCYACDLRARTRTAGAGHVFQQRYWSHPIYDERHFLNVLRYIEANPRAARMVSRAEDWPWSSVLRPAAHLVLDPLPLRLPANWITLVNEDRDPAEPD